MMPTDFSESYAACFLVLSLYEASNTRAPRLTTTLPRARARTLVSVDADTVSGAEVPKLLPT